VPILKCAVCGMEWPDLDSVLADPGLSLVGYQVNFGELRAGFFLFNHSCDNTLALTVDAFRELHDGPVFTERRTGEAECPGYCLRKRELGPCLAKCECAFVRDLIQQIRLIQEPRGCA
jgi:hypothetical protein